MLRNAPSCQFEPVENYLILVPKGLRLAQSDIQESALRNITC